MSGVGSFNPRAGQTPNIQGNVSGQGINQGGRQGIKANPPYNSNGPLNALYNNKYIPTSYIYPSDLANDGGAAHIIQFSINETKGSSADPTPDSLTSTISSKLNEVEKSGKSEGRTWQPDRSRISNTVSLYIPDSIVTSYGANYNETSLAEGLADIGTKLSASGKGLEGIPGVSALLKGLGGTISGALDAAQSNAGKLALSAGFNKAFNPRKQLMFEGIDFRTFNFTFTFSPTNKTESDAVNDIVRLFKYHAAPTIQSGAAAGFFFIPPSSFTIEFLYRDLNGSINPNTYVNKIAESVLEKVDVNYSPNGTWSAFDGTGAPTQIQLTLSFKEIELIDKTLIGDVNSAQGGF